VYATAATGPAGPTDKALAIEALPKASKMDYENPMMNSVLLNGSLNCQYQVTPTRRTKKQTRPAPLKARVNESNPQFVVRCLIHIDCIVKKIATTIAKNTGTNIGTLTSSWINLGLCYLDKLITIPQATIKNIPYKLLDSSF